MNLYATIESERATKGQGGEYLDIEIRDERKHIFATIQVREQETGTGHTIEVWYNGFNTEVNSYSDRSVNEWEARDNMNRTTKGEKQKGEVCERCDKFYTAGHIGVDGYGKKCCDDCGN